MTSSLRCILPSGIALAVAFCLCAFLVGCSASDEEGEDYSLAKEGVLSVAASLDDPPFSSLEANEAAGFSVALAKEVAHRMGLECDIVDTSRDECASKVMSGACDIALPLESLDAPRDEGLDVSDPFVVVDQAIIAKERVYDSADDLKGRKIAVVKGSTGERIAVDVVQGDAVEYESVEKCFAALKSGAVSAVVSDVPVAEKCTFATGCAVVERVATGERFGFLVGKDDPALRSSIDEVLSSMEEDGSLDALRKEYLGL